ncbi:MAG TPA: ABC transporter substrate-binding protein [Lapillicoccus sp.]|nr:ABC transporter substrate-binding protein [Lapillicoccus sp.]
MSDQREERRVVTALFADVVGSTPLGERLVPEELKLVMQEAITRIIRAVEAFGGTVKDLAGDGVMALFGAPVAHEDDAERAIRAGLRIVDDIADYGRDVERAWGLAEFSVRVGISTGLVVVGAVGAGRRVEYAALGDAVNTAARLQTAARPGSVLVGTDTQRLARYAFVWADPVELSLKGKAEPYAAAQVLGVSAIPSRGHGFEGAQAALVGRERELSAGGYAVEAALAGTGGVVFLTGEPGIGKTRLLGELRAAFEDGSPARGRPRWLEGRCVSYGESMPYWPLRDLLRSWLGVLADEPELRVRVALRRQVDGLFPDGAADIYPYLGSLLGLTLEPDVGARLAELSPEALQYRTFEVVRALAARLAADGPVVFAVEDLHWADATSLQLLQRLAADTDSEALLLVLTSRPERDHGVWRLKEDVGRELPHRVWELTLDALSGDAGRELLTELVGTGTLPPDTERRILELAEGNPFFLEEIVRSLADAGALVHDEQGAWKVGDDVPVEIPATVEKVILARIDRLEPAEHEALVAASVLGRQFGLPLLEGVADRPPEEVRAALNRLQRLDLVREGRRWPEPEFRFKHALIQDAAYRTLLREHRTRLHRQAAEWLGRQYAGREDEVAGLLAHHWLGAEDEERATVYLTRAGDRAREEYGLDEAIVHYRQLLPILERRGQRREIALVLFKLALALHMTLRFAEANAAYQRAFDRWDVPRPAVPSTETGATIRVGTSFLPNDPDPRSAIAWPNIQLGMHLFDRLVEAWPERTIVPSLADRWEIADDGLRYVFHLRDGLRWSDGHPLTAHDVEFGIKRVLNPDAPGSSVAIYFVLEHGQDFYLRRTDDADAIGVRALDDLTVEFRLVAPAPYFMSVMNRPDAGPQPRHAIEAAGDGWTDDQVVSGAFRVASQGDGSLVLERRQGESPRAGNVAVVDYVQGPPEASLEAYGRGELDMIAVRYTPRLADLMPASAPKASIGPAAWSGYLSFDHAHPDTAKLDLRRALALAVDREQLFTALPVNMIVATGGVVPPALQGHTPDIALRFQPDLARQHLARAGPTGPLRLAVLEENRPLVAAVVESWRETLGLEVEVHPWTQSEVLRLRRPWDVAPIVMTGWLPGYADPEYFLRLLFQSDSRTNEGGFTYAPYDEIIERARQERSDRGRLELFHQADRMAVADRVACIPLVYARSMAVVKPWVHGWWEFGKTSANYADLQVDPHPPEPVRPPS